MKRGLAFPQTIQGTLEPALKSRGGRIDQTKEFALPGDECRHRLVALYAAGLVLSPDLVSDVVTRNGWRKRGVYQEN